MALLLPAGLKRLAVENVHGKAWEELTPEKIDDCLLELLNVLAGNFLSDLCGAETRQYMALPELLFEEMDLQDGVEPETFHYDAEGHEFTVCVTLAHTA